MGGIKYADLHETTVDRRWSRSSGGALPLTESQLLEIQCKKDVLLEEFVNEPNLLQAHAEAIYWDVLEKLTNNWGDIPLSSLSSEIKAVIDRGNPDTLQAKKDAIWDVLAAKMWEVMNAGFHPAFMKDGCWFQFCLNGKVGIFPIAIPQAAPEPVVTQPKPAWIDYEALYEAKHGVNLRDKAENDGNWYMDVVYPLSLNDWAKVQLEAVSF